MWNPQKTVEGITEKKILKEFLWQFLENFSVNTILAGISQSIVEGTLKGILMKCLWNPLRNFSMHFWKDSRKNTLRNFQRNLGIYGLFLICIWKHYWKFHLCNSWRSVGRISRKSMYKFFYDSLKEYLQISFNKFKRNYLVGLLGSFLGKFSKKLSSNRRENSRRNLKRNRYKRNSSKNSRSNPYKYSNTTELVRWSPELYRMPGQDYENKLFLTHPNGP